MRTHIIRVHNRRGELVNGVNFEVFYDDEFVHRVLDSDGNFTASNIPDSVDRIRVRAFDDRHDEERTISADDKQYTFVFKRSPVPGFDWLGILYAFTALLKALAEFIKGIKPKFLNWFAVFLVTSGVGMLSQPWWLPILYDLLGRAIPDVFEPPSEVVAIALIVAGIGVALFANRKSSSL